jgi:hypothetical protein
MYIDWRCVHVIDDIDCFYDLTFPISMYWSMGWIKMKWNDSSASPCFFVFRNAGHHMLKWEYLALTVIINCFSLDLFFLPKWMNWRRPLFRVSSLYFKSFENRCVHISLLIFRFTQPTTLQPSINLLFLAFSFVPWQPSLLCFIFSFITFYFPFLSDRFAVLKWTEYSENMNLQSTNPRLIIIKISASFSAACTLYSTWHQM